MSLDLGLDRSDMLGWLGHYPGQLATLYPRGRSAGAALAGRDYTDVLVLGTGGGSAAAAYVVASLARPRSLAPFMVYQGYEPPLYAPARAGRTLTIAVSHSGQTEETLAALDALPRAILRDVAVISGGGPLAERARDGGLPWVELPVGMQARAVFPGIVAALLGILDGAGLTVRPFDNEVPEAADLAAGLVAQWGPGAGGVPGRASEAEGAPLALARRAAEHLLLVYGGAGATEGIARRWKNQLAENGKTLAHWYTIPEAHHDEVVGWDAPPAIREHLFGCLLRDREAESPKMGKRLDVTRRLLAGRIGEDRVVEVAAAGSSPLARAMSLCLYGDYLSCYVALLRGVDPTPVPIIVDLKREMARE